MRRSNAGLFWPVLVLVTAIDFCTKAIAATPSGARRMPHDVYGDWMRFTLVHNPGAAFGLHVGEHSRWIFMVLTVVALVILGAAVCRHAAGRRDPHCSSLALVCGGALGNLIDRIVSKPGVIDFIDIGMGDSRWPTFNVADMAVSIGAFLLAWVLWGEDAETELVPVSTPATGDGDRVAASC